MLTLASRTCSEVLAAIHEAAFPPAERWSRDVFDLQLALPNVLCLMHQAGGLILLRLAADEAEILTLAVIPPERRRGAGHALLSEAAGIARSQGAKALFLEVSVSNIAARALYTKVGFGEVGRRPRYYSDRSDAIVLRLDLAAE